MWLQQCLRKVAIRRAPPCPILRASPQTARRDPRQKALRLAPVLARPGLRRFVALAWVTVPSLETPEAATGSIAKTETGWAWLSIVTDCTRSAYKIICGEDAGSDL